MKDAGLKIFMEIPNNILFDIPSVNADMCHILCMNVKGIFPRREILKSKCFSPNSNLLIVLILSPNKITNKK